MIGTRIDKLVLFRRTPRPVGEGMWHRVAVTVMHRPVVIGGAVIVLLLLLGAPFLRVSFGLPDDRVDPTSATIRQVQDQIRANFTSEVDTPVKMVAPVGGDQRTHLESIVGFVSRHILI